MDGRGGFDQQEMDISKSMARTEQDNRGRDAASSEKGIGNPGGRTHDIFVHTTVTAVGIMIRMYESCGPTDLGSKSPNSIMRQQPPQ